MPGWSGSADVVPDGAVGTAFGEGLRAQLGVAHLCGRGEDAGHVLGQIAGSGGQWADAAHHPENQTVSGVAVLRVAESQRTVHDAVNAAQAALAGRLLVINRAPRRSDG